MYVTRYISQFVTTLCVKLISISLSMIKKRIHLKTWTYQVVWHTFQDKIHPYYFQTDFKARVLFKEKSTFSSKQYNYVSYHHCHEKHNPKSIRKNRAFPPLADLTFHQPKLIITIKNPNHYKKNNPAKETSITCPGVPPYLPRFGSRVGVEGYRGGVPGAERVRGGDVPQGGCGGEAWPWEAVRGAVPPTMVQVVDALDVQVG